jgi:hypothetical protein
MRVRHAQRTVSFSQRSAGRPRSATPNRCAIRISYVLGPSSGASSGSSTRSSASSFSPRNIARMRCDGSFVNGSEKSK